MNLSVFWLKGNIVWRAPKVDVFLKYSFELDAQDYYNLVRLNMIKHSQYLYSLSPSRL